MDSTHVKTVLLTIYDTSRGASSTDRGARYTVLYVARGGFITVLHIVLGMTLKGRAPAPPYDVFSIDGDR